MIKSSNFRTGHARYWEFSSTYKLYATSLLFALSNPVLALVPAKSVAKVTQVTSVTVDDGNDSSNGNGGSSNNDMDNNAISSIPQNITELKGQEITFSNSNTYISVNRPWEYDKMFLLYNVGTGKFLNVGGYWGTHAELSEVPRPFWFQRRNDKKVSGLYAYKRYPDRKSVV